MARVAVLFDIEEGHFYTNFRFSKKLRERGHEVVYLGLASAGPMVRRQGFELIPVFEHLFSGIDRVSQTKVTSSEWFGQLIRGEALDDAMRRVKPDLVIMLSLYYPETLAVLFRYQVAIVLWTAACRPAEMTRAELIEDQVSSRLMALRSSDLEALLDMAAAAGVQVSSFRDLAAVVARMPELIVLPGAIELPHKLNEPNIYYIGTGVDLEREDDPFPWHEIPEERYLVYCSLGSQSDLEPETARGFFRAVLGAAQARPEWQFLLSLGKGFDPAELVPVPPPNLCLKRWVPQLDVLRRADLMVTHGGPGTVKEAILMGVPMVVLPLMRDQFEMAQRVVHHRVGVMGNLAGITAEALGVLLSQAATDGTLKERVAAMRELFLEADRTDRSFEVVESSLAQGPASLSGKM